MDERTVERIKRAYPEGTRIQLDQMGDDPNPIEPGTKGTVDFVDDIGTVHCRFDNGRYLGLVAGEDWFHEIEDMGRTDVSGTMPEAAAVSPQYMKCESYGTSFDICIEASTYVHGGGMALELLFQSDDDLEPYSNLTVNISSVPLGPDCAYVDTNNLPSAEAMIKQYNLGKPTGRIGCSGYCTYPEYRFDMEKVAKYCVNPEDLPEIEPKKKERGIER